MKQRIGIGIAGLGAGILNGLFGAGGGMVLVPLLSTVAHLEEALIFPTSVAVILPIAISSLLLGSKYIPLLEALPYFLGSIIGGIMCGFWGKKIPTLWLHRILGAMILWGGVRYLC